MASGSEMQPYQPELPEDPDRLWIWERHVYLDEHQRSWPPILLKSSETFQVLLRQTSIPLGRPMGPKELEAYELPLMWQLYPGGRYRGTDSMFWKILYHIKFRGVEDMLLERLPSDD